MKTLILLISLVTFSSFSQANKVNYRDVLESDSASIQTRISSIHAILKREKKKLQDTTIVAYYVQLADLYRENQDFRSAILFCDTILKQYNKVSFYLLKEVEEQKALYQKEIGETEKAISTMLNILSEFEDRGDFGESAKLNQRLGIIFLKLNDVKNAEYHLKEGIIHARKVNDSETEGYCLMSLGNRFKKDNRFKEAGEKYNESIAIAKRENIQRLLAGNYNNYGSLYNMSNNLDRAMYYYKLAVNINKETNNDQWLSYNYNNLGNIYNKKKQYKEALRYFMLSKSIKDKTNDFRGVVETMQNIAEAYNSLGQYQQAYIYETRHLKLKDSIATLDNADLTKRLAAEFQAERREADIVRLNMQDKLNKQRISADDERNAAKDERISYQNFLSWVMGIAISLICLIALLLFRSVMNRTKINSELRSKNEKIDAQHKEIIDSINYAKRIQNSILPGKERLKLLLQNYAILYKPKDIISGDFYVCDSTDDGVYFGTIDCTGHGVPGAMVSLVVSSHFNKMLHELNLNSPGAILNQLNKEVPDALALENEVINDGMDMALCLINKERTELKFSGAYQNCWVLNERKVNDNRMLNGPTEIHELGDYSIIEIKGERQGIGKTTNEVIFTTKSIKLFKGDKIALSTDGYQDQFGGEGNKKFKVKEMRNLILQNGSKSPEELIESLSTTLTKWQGEHEQIDDICILIIEV